MTVAEVFAGGGLMATGLSRAGYTLSWANDFDKHAVAAYRANLGGHVVHGDITAIDFDTIPDTDVIAGGPPCQDFSVAGTGAGEDGERGRLVWTYLALIERKKPRAFIFENVKGLVGKRHRATFDALLTKFDEIGYTVSWRIVNAWDYGVAQKRERVFIVGIRKDLGFTFEFPEPDAELYRTQVLRDVIGDLPEPGEYFYVNRGSWGEKLAKSVYGLNDVSPTIKAQNMPFPPGYPGHPNDANVPNHIGGVTTAEYPGHTASKLEGPAKTVVAGAHGVPGEANCFYPENHDPKPLSEHIQERLDSGGYESYLRKHPIKQMDDPCGSVTTRYANPLDALYMPDSPPPRRFTVRECLRIQSVPDAYVLPDSISLSAQYRIVGNGVASRVAYLLGIALAAQLNDNKTEVTA